MAHTFQHIDAANEAKALRKERAEEAAFAAWLANLDKRQVDLLGAKAPTGAKTAAAKRATEAKAKADKMAALHGAPVDISARKAEFLAGRGPQLESLLARHMELRDNAEAYGADRAEQEQAVAEIEAALKASAEAQ